MRVKFPASRSSLSSRPRGCRVQKRNKSGRPASSAIASDRRAGPPPLLAEPPQHGAKGGPIIQGWRDRDAPAAHRPPASSQGAAAGRNFRCVHFRPGAGASRPEPPYRLRLL
jgi:hypothetical protein